MLAHLAFREPNPLACPRGCATRHWHRRAKRIRVHVVQPALVGLELSADTAKVLSAFARQRSMFSEVQAHEADRIAIASHEGEVIAARRDGGARSLREMKGALLGSTRPRSPEEIEEEVERPKAGGEPTSAPEAT